MPGIIDSTLREGEQAPGVYLSARERRAVVVGLAEAGVDEIEVGPAGREDLDEVVRMVRTLAPGIRLSIWCRARENDLRRACACAPDVVAVSVPASDGHLVGRLGRDRHWALSTIAMLPALVPAGARARLAVGLEDATRADPGFVAEMAVAAATAGVARLRIADSLGVAGPTAVARLVQQVRRWFPGEVAFHGHDDFGAAAGNAYAAWDTGADLVDGSLLGLGERAGIARTEALVGWLALRCGLPRYRTEGLPCLCRRIATAVGRRLERTAPVVGDGLFTCETGIHAHGLLRDPASYEPFPPERVGAERRLLLGAKSGRAAVAAAAAGQGMRLEGAGLDQAVARVRGRAQRLGRPLAAAEVAAVLTGGD